MRIAIAAASLVLASGEAAAQQEPGPSALEHAENAAETRVQAPAQDARSGIPGSGVQLETDGDSTTVSLTASGLRDFHNDRLLGRVRFSLGVSVPITDSDNEEGTFLTEGGLPNAISAKGSISIVLTGNPPTGMTEAEQRRRYEAARDQCLERVALDGQVTDDDRDRCGREPVTNEVDRWTNEPLLLVGGSVSVGTRNFAYRSIADFSEQDVDRTEYAVSVNFGLNPSASRLYIGAGYEFRRQYEAATSRTLCRAPVTSAPQECFTGPFAVPVRNVDSSIFGDVRYQFDLGRPGRTVPIGIGIHVTYDTHDDIFGASVPIYFLANSDGDLTGGVRFDWQDSDDPDERFGVRVFIGRAFNLFGR